LKIIEVIKQIKIEKLKTKPLSNFYQFIEEKILKAKREMALLKKEIG